MPAASANAVAPDAGAMAALDMPTHTATELLPEAGDHGITFVAADSHGALSPVSA